MRLETAIIIAWSVTGFIIGLHFLSELLEDFARNRWGVLTMDELNAAFEKELK